MSLDGTGEDDGGWSVPDLLAFVRKLRRGPPPADDAIGQYLAARARDARLPQTGGLFGSGYAAYMADNAPQPTPTPGAPSAGDPMQWLAQFAAGGPASPADSPPPGVPTPSPAQQAPAPLSAADDQAPDDGDDGDAQLAPAVWSGGQLNLDGGVAHAPDLQTAAVPANAVSPSSGAPGPAAQPPAYSSAYRQGRDMATVYVRPDGAQDVYTGGSMAWRNNNPGNLGYTPFSRRHGAIGSYTLGKNTFAIFPDAATGEKASQALLKGPSYRDKTLDDVIAKYAPKGQNDTALYQAQVRQALGVAGATRLRDLTDAQWDGLFAAIRRKEGSKPGAISSRPAGER